MRLPKSVKAAAEQVARKEGVSLNPFVATAVAEKLSALETARFFAERRERADLQAFIPKTRPSTRTLKESRDFLSKQCNIVA